MMFILFVSRRKSIQNVWVIVLNQDFVITHLMQFLSNFVNEYTENDSTEIMNNDDKLETNRYL